MPEHTLRLGSKDRRLDVAAMEGGVEKECTLFRPGFYVTVLPAVSFNRRYRKAMIARNERLAASNGKPEKADSEASYIIDMYADPEFVVDGLVAGMRGIYDVDGNEVEYTREVGLAVLADAGNADVLDWIANEARDYGRYYTDGLEDDAKNSPTDSGGSAAGVGGSEKTAA